MTTTTTNYTINTLPSKKEIVERLFKAGHINLDEVLELMEPRVQVNPVTPQQIYYPAPNFHDFWYSSANA
jgi:hypothetical protein